MTISTDIVESFKVGSNPIEQKQCFVGVKYNNKPRWEPPTGKLNNGLWDLKDFMTGTLDFIFTLDPVSYKKEQSAINKKIAAAEAAGKPIKDPAKLKPKPKEPLSEKSMSRTQASQSQYEKLVSTMIKNFRDEKDQSNEELIKAIQGKHSLWTNQAVDALMMFQDLD